MKKLLLSLAFLLGLIGTAEAQGAGQLPAGYLWGNPTAARAPAQPSTPSSIFDRFFTCSTQGSLIDRGATQWQCLTPVANSFLITNGSGVPGWSNAAASNLLLTTSSANALAVGPAGATNPSFNVDASTASSATGLNVKSAAAGAGIAVSAISSGTNENLTIDAKGSGTITLNGTGTGNITLGRNTGVTGTDTVTSNSSSAFAVGPNGATNPSFKVDASVASAATGLNIQGAAAGSGLQVLVISSGTNENISLNAKGSGVVNIGGISTGQVQLGGGGGGVLVTNSFTATGLVTFADMATAAVATSSQYIAGTASTLVPSNIAYTAEQTTTFGATTSFDFSTFINTAVTLTGNITTMNVSNVKAGQAGQIRFIQDATGSRTTVWNSTFKFSNGTTPTLSTTANAIDVLFYSCVSTSLCYASLTPNMK